MIKLPPHLYDRLKSEIDHWGGIGGGAVRNNVRIDGKLVAAPLCLIGFMYELNVVDEVKAAIGREMDIGTQNDRAVASINAIRKTFTYGRVPSDEYFEKMDIVRGEE